MRRRHPTYSDAASSSSTILKFIHTVQALYLRQQLNWQSSRFPIWLLRVQVPFAAPYADILKRLKRCVLKTRRGVKACEGSNPSIRAINLALWTNWQSYQAFNLEFAGSIPARVTIWLCGRTGRVAALSRRSLWDHAPPESPYSGVLVQKSRMPACLGHL